MAALRLFVAVWPPAAVIHALGSVPTGEGRRTPPERLHVTMRFLGDVAGDAVPALAEALGSAIATQVRAPVVAALGPTTATFGRSVLHVPVVGLDGLADVVAAGCRGFGAADADRPFAGHLTLARGRRDRHSRDGDLRRVAGAAVPAAAREPWPVEEATLVCSRPGAGGVRYDLLTHFPLPRGA